MWNRLQYANNKGYCEDFSEGKFSFPIVHSIRADTTNRQILSPSLFFSHSLRGIAGTDHVHNPSSQISFANDLRRLRPKRTPCRT